MAVLGDKTANKRPNAKEKSQKTDKIIKCSYDSSLNDTKNRRTEDCTEDRNTVSFFSVVATRKTSQYKNLVALALKGFLKVRFRVLD